MPRKWIAAVFATGWAIAQTPDPLAVATPADVTSGKRIFDSQCALCHGIGGTGGRGPALTKAKDAAHGKLLYAAKGCRGCHVVNGDGTAYGPELTEIGAQRSAAFLRESILDPGVSVPDGFVVVKATPRRGTAVSGVRLNEDSFTIQLRDASGRFHSFRKQDLADLQKDVGKSPMPSYRATLASAEVDDLVAYLAGLKERQ